MNVATETPFLIRRGLLESTLVPFFGEGLKTLTIDPLPRGTSDMGFSRRSTSPDPDPVATQEWRDSIRAVADQLGEDEAKRLLHATVESAKDAGVDIDVVDTPYLNTIHPEDQGSYPGDLDLE